ncbi:type II toxin-antitoxin system antitoxin SocA domain-containing protein [Streptomyces sp. NPDC014748]|uniref:type II toxin-antitoxin system antitoxin SocA domain-containing protein n=1 Tax=unclassified Streptomyces TaxID=2593676 RepID=UPI00146B0288|nr:type II toxin-antitoxin system antitoxin SocA domain-containing protein [Streptomyces sp. GMY02]NMO32826.1 SocA family protein [Streptomyces sp. GMY02]
MDHKGDHLALSDHYFERLLLSLVGAAMRQRLNGGTSGGVAMTMRGTSAAVVQLLSVARASGVIVNRTKLAKLLFLADFEAVDQGCAPGSGVEWRWRHFGPYSDSLRDIEADLEQAGVVKVVETTNYYGTLEVRLALAGETPQVEIDAKFAEIVEHIVSEKGRLSATQLKDLTYQTPPMVAAQKLGQREVRLDLAGGAPIPDLEPGLQRLRAIALTMSPLDDEVGAVEELASDIDSLSELRREATGSMLDGD